jgi:nitrous oxidase accessory protein
MLAAALLATILVVSPGGPYTSITDALADAQPGDTILVQGGVYPALVLNKSVTLRGELGAVIDAGGSGDVVTIEAPGAVLEGFELRNSGRLLEDEPAGVTVLAADVVVRNNVLSNVLFGVFVKQGDRAVVEGNDISGYEYDPARRGDGIRTWYSQDVRVTGNHVQGMRDVIMWFSGNAVIEGNTIRDGRYGLHFMYDDGMLVRDNEVMDNSVGLFLMYSSNVVLERNLIRDNFGPSGYAIGLKEIANIEVRDNVLLRNRIGVSFDTVPHGLDAYARFTGNLVAFNHIGMSFQPSTKDVELLNNAFDRNGTQIQIRGRGDLAGNVWNAERGNYWSDYVGYDADGDGIGDLAYEPQSLFESLRDERPVLGLFNYGPAALAVDFAALAVPNLRPSAKVVDEAPLLSVVAPGWFQAEPTNSLPLVGLGALLGTLGLIVGRGMSRGFLSVRPVTVGSRAEPAPTAIGDEATMEILQARGLTKRYGARTVLDALDFSVSRGEAVALWGGNGAGKTTALRCVIGVIQHEGEVIVDGLTLSDSPKLVRERVGYVPQDQQLPDLPSDELLRFFGALRGAGEDEIQQTVELVGIEQHLDKRPNELSGGLRQRLALALALLGRPPLLLLDEPTANLDEATRSSIFALLNRLREQGTAVVFTTHRADEVIAFADRVITLADGRVVNDEDANSFARGVSDGQENMLIRVAEDELERARELLVAAELNVTLRSGWLTVHQCQPDQPLRVLFEQQIEVLESAVGSHR